MIGAAALAPNLPLALAVLILVGSGSITFNSSAKTVWQRAATPHMRRRVISIWSIGWMGGTVVGAPAVGAIGAAYGPRSKLLTDGVAAAAVGSAVLAVSFLSRLSARARYREFPGQARRRSGTRPASTPSGATGITGGA